MGQQLSWFRPDDGDDDPNKEEEVVLMLTDKEHSLTHPSVPAFVRTQQCGLNEVKVFLQRKLIVPVSYNRRIMTNPHKVTNLRHLEQNIVSVEKLMVVMGRSSVGKRSLVQQVCHENNLAMMLLNTPGELHQFDMQGFLAGLKSEAILVIESTAIGPLGGEHGKLHDILKRALQLPVNSYLQTVILLLHASQDFDMLKLNQYMIARFNCMYARVPPLNERKEFIRSHIQHFMDHRLVNQLGNMVNFTEGFDQYLDKLSQASAWYTPSEIEVFLERCYHIVLVNLIGFSDQTQIPHDAPMIYFREIVETYLQRSPENPNTFTLNMEKKETLSQGFEYFFNLKLVSIDDTQWLHMVDPQLSAIHTTKRKIEEPPVDVPAPPEKKQHTETSPTLQAYSFGV